MIKWIPLSSFLYGLFVCLFFSSFFSILTLAAAHKHSSFWVMYYTRFEQLCFSLVRYCLFPLRRIDFVFHKIEKVNKTTTTTNNKNANIRRRTHFAWTPTKAAHRYLCKSAKRSKWMAFSTFRRSHVVHPKYWCRYRFCYSLQHLLGNLMAFSRIAQLNSIKLLLQNDIFFLGDTIQILQRTIKKNI